MDREIFERLIWWTLARGQPGLFQLIVTILQQVTALIKRRAIQALNVKTASGLSIMAQHRQLGSYDVKACENDLDREVQIRVCFRFKPNRGFFTIRLARKRICEDSELSAFAASAPLLARTRSSKCC